MTLSLSHYLVVGAIMFTIGLFGALSKRHAIAVIISIELMLNAVNINFIAFSKYMMGDVGEIMAIFVIALAAAEVAAALRQTAQKT